ncbi:MAG: rod shape-determining protein MreC [Nitrospirae bacterium]|nr:rod shape-determining protein MreC [Nitrospirota bacterium]
MARLKPHFFYTHKRGLLLIAIILIAIILMSPDLQKRPRYYLIEKPVVFVISLFQRGFTQTGAGIKGVWSSYINLIGVQKENALLKQEIGHLRAENTRYKEMTHSLERMQTLLEFKDNAPFRTISVRVIGRDTSNLFKTITIDSGEGNGIKKDMAVITPDAVVGRVIRTSRNSSLVLLMIDRNSAIASIIQRTRDEGIIEGRGGSIANLKYIQILSDIQSGDVVITSGIDGIYPKGMNIGRVVSAKKESDVIFQEVAVAPVVDFTRLEEVLVVVDNNKK